MGKAKPCAFTRSTARTTSEARAADIVSAQTKRDLELSSRVSDRAEANFGVEKYLKQLFDKLDGNSISGLAMSRVNHQFEPALDFVQREADADGKLQPTAYSELPEKVQRALLEAARQAAAPAAVEDKIHWNSFLAAKAAAQKARREAALTKAAKAHAESANYFRMRVWSSAAEVDEELAKLPSKSAKLQALKDQINIRVKGFRWPEWKVPFSSCTDASIGTLENLTAKVKLMIAGTSGRAPPDEPFSAEPRTRALHPLGTFSAEAEALRSQKCWTDEELRTKHEEVAAELEAHLAKKKKHERDKYAQEQPDEPPEIDDALLEKRIEVLTNVVEENDEGVNVTYKQWLPGVIKEVSDGSSTKRDKAGHKRAVPAGSCLVEYDDGFVSWARIRKEDFNCARLGSWRFDLDAVAMSGVQGEAEVESEGEGGSTEESASEESEAESQASETESDGGV